MAPLKGAPYEKAPAPLKGAPYEKRGRP